METFEQVIELSTPPSEKKYACDLSMKAFRYDMAYRIVVSQRAFLKLEHSLALLIKQSSELIQP